MERFPELRDDELDGERRRVAAAILGGSRGSLQGPFQAPLRSPGLADKMQKLGAWLCFECSLPADLKELAIWARVLEAIGALREDRSQ